MLESILILVAPFGITLAIVAWFTDNFSNWG
jgi:hypothetical protein